jgi:hypothetical protein
MAIFEWFLLASQEGKLFHDERDPPPLQNGELGLPQAGDRVRNGIFENVQKNFKILLTRPPAL